VLAGIAVARKTEQETHSETSSLPAVGTIQGIRLDLDVYNKTNDAPHYSLGTDIATPQGLDQENHSQWPKNKCLSPESHKQGCVGGRANRNRSARFKIDRQEAEVIGTQHVNDMLVKK